MSTDKNYSATNDHAQEPGQEEPEYMQLARQDTQPPPQVESVQQAQARTQAQQYPGLPGAPETASNKLMPYQGTLVAIQLIRVILESLPLALLVVVIVSSFFKTYGPPQASIILLIFIILIPYEAHLALQFIAVPQLIRGVRLSWVRNINICSLVLAPIMAFYVYMFMGFMFLLGQSRRYGEEIAVLPAVAVLAVEVALCVIMIVAAQKTLNNRTVAKAAIYYSNI